MAQMLNQLLCLGFSGYDVISTDFFSKQDTLSCHKLLPHMLVALQATFMSHHLFGAICNIILNSVSIVLYVACASLCLSYYKGFRRSRDE